MRLTGATKVAGVVGWPIAHSLSPLIHNAWIEAMGMNAAYVPFAVPPERFEAFVDGLRGGALAGLNVTLPFKTRARTCATLMSDVVAYAGSANVLLFLEDESVFADNTDGVGLLSALQGSGTGWTPRAGPVLLIGAGGAADGAVRALSEAGVPEVRIAARRAQAALKMMKGRETQAYAFSDLSRAMTGVTAVINATSAGLNGVGELPPMDAAPRGAVFMDMVYSPLRTTFLQRAAARAHPTVDGLAMLIGQARPSFEAFFGVAPPPPEVVDVRALCLAALGEAPYGAGA